MPNSKKNLKRSHSRTKSSDTRNSIPDPVSIEIFLSNAFNKILDEVSCTLCSNVFIKSMLLTCGHSFCFFCITQERRTTLRCPICRKLAYELKSNFCIDSLIEKLSAKTSDDCKNRRTKLIEKRLISERELPGSIISDSESDYNSSLLARIRKQRRRESRNEHSR